MPDAQSEFMRRLIAAEEKVSQAGLDDGKGPMTFLGGYREALCDVRSILTGGRESDMIVKFWRGTTDLDSTIAVACSLADINKQGRGGPHER